VPRRRPPPSAGGGGAAPRRLRSLYTCTALPSANSKCRMLNLQKSGSFETRPPVVQIITTKVMSMLLLQRLPSTSVQRRRVISLLFRV
jgi:hypothetical protein